LQLQARLISRHADPSRIEVSWQPGPHPERVERMGFVIECRLLERLTFRKQCTLRVAKYDLFDEHEAGMREEDRPLLTITVRGVRDRRLGTEMGLR